MKQQIIRQIGQFNGKIQYQDHLIIFNFKHKINSTLLFTRMSDDSLPQHLKQFVQNTLQLFQQIHQLPDDKIAINHQNQLILSIKVGKKIKEFKIAFQKANLSNQQALNHRIADLQKKLQKKQFQAQFFKQQYIFLLNKLQIRPKLQNFQGLYQKGDLTQLFVVKQYQRQKIIKSYKSQVKQQKVGGIFNKLYNSQIKQIQSKCINGHKMLRQPTKNEGFKCNICRKFIKLNFQRLVCTPCDFDLCFDCHKQGLIQKCNFCPKQHALKFGNAKTPYLARYCDKCRKTLAFQKGYSCIECNYDLCPKCNDNR